MRCATLLPIAALLGSASANAQEAPSQPFTGAHAGAEVGAVDHHFVLTVTGPTGSSDRNVTRWGVGGAAFAGYDLALAPRIVGGVAAEFDLGGRTPSTTLSGTRYAIKPRYGYGLTARVGYVVADGVMTYFRGGFGGHLYRFDVPAGQREFGPWNQSFILSGGAEFVVHRETAVRTEFEHLDGSRNQFMLGLVARFGK